MRNGVRPREYTFDALFVGQKAEFGQTIERADIAAFARVSGDMNPLHTDHAFARGTAYGDVVAHGMYLGGLLSRLVGMELPGLHSLLCAEYLEFKNPVRIGDRVIVRGEITYKSVSTRMVELAVTMRRGDDIVATGTARTRLLR